MNKSEIQRVQRQERRRVRSINAEKRKRIKEWTKMFKIHMQAFDYAWVDIFTGEIVFYASIEQDEYLKSRPHFSRVEEDMLDNSFAYYMFKEPQ